MSVRSELQHRATHLGRTMKAGLSPLWAVIAVAIALVGGSVAITVAWGVRHLNVRSAEAGRALRRFATYAVPAPPPQAWCGWTSSHVLPETRDMFLLL